MLEPLAVMIEATATKKRTLTAAAIVTAAAPHRCLGRTAASATTEQYPYGHTIHYIGYERIRTAGRTSHSTVLVSGIYFSYTTYQQPRCFAAAAEKGIGCILCVTRRGWWGEVYCDSVFGGYVVPVAALNEVTTCLIYHGALFILLLIFRWTSHC